MIRIEKPYITETLMSALEKKGVKRIRLIGSLTEEPVRCEGAVGSSMSMGVDSVYTAHRFCGEDAPAGMRLTHFTQYSGDYLIPFQEPPYDVEALTARQDADRVGFYRRQGRKSGTDRAGRDSRSEISDDTGKADIRGDDGMDPG